MKIAYRGHLYEENYHFSKIGYFNKDFQLSVKKTVSDILPQVIKTLNSPIQYIPSRLVVSDKTLPPIYLHNKSKDEADATIEKYENGILIRFNDYFFNNTVMVERIEVILFHEVTHIYQIVLGVYNFDEIANKETNKENRFKYFNDPKEINAIINSIVMYITNNKEARDYLKKVSLDLFIKKAFIIIGHSEEELLEYMEEGAIITFYESLTLLRSKLINGEYD